MRHSNEVIEKVKELKKEWYSHREIKDEIARTLDVQVGLGSISRRTQDIRENIQEVQDTIQQISESDTKEPEYDDENLYVYSSKTNKFWEKEKIRFEIPFSILNEIQRSYVKKGKNWTQQDIIDHNWWTNTEPLYIDWKARNAIKSALDLSKKSWITNQIFLKILEDKYGKFELEKYMEDRALSTERQRHIDLELKKNDKAREKMYKRALRFMSRQEIQMDMLEKAIAEYKPKKIDFQIEKPKNNDKAYIALADIHFWRTSNVVKERLNKILWEIEELDEDNIVLLNLWDNTESIIPEWMHNWQVLEMDILGSEQFMGIVDLFEEFVLEIYKMGKTVSVHGMTKSNHDRTHKHYKWDPERIVGFCFFKLLERGLRNVDVMVKWYKEMIGTHNDEHLRFIMAHGDEKFNNKKTEAILYWDYWKKVTESNKHYQTVRYENWKMHIIISWHWHTYELDSGPWWKRILVPSINDPNSFAVDKFMGAEEPGYVIIKPTEKSAEIIFRPLV